MDCPCLQPPALAVKCWTAGGYQQLKLFTRERLKQGDRIILYISAYLNSFQKYLIVGLKIVKCLSVDQLAELFFDLCPSWYLEVDL